MQGYGVPMVGMLSWAQLGSLELRHTIPLRALMPLSAMPAPMLASPSGEKQDVSPRQLAT